MRKRQKIILFYSLIFLFFLIIGGFAFAQRPLEIEYPAIEGIKPELTTISLQEYVKYIFNFSLGLAGVIVFSILIYAGFRYFTSAGDPGRMKDARDRIAAAFLGLAVLLLSYLILTTINPQLTFLRLPGRIIFTPEPIIEPAAQGLGLLSYTEIPLGGIIGQLFLETRLLKMRDISQDLQNQAEEVKNLSAELKKLTDGCSCANADNGACETGSCSTGSAGCVSNCYCQGDPGSEHDPCPSREAIGAKQAKLKSGNKTLADWQEKFTKEINDYRTLYANLLAAEERVKNCSQEIGESGSPNAIFGYNEFWTYRQKLEDDKLISGVAPEKPFLPITSEGPYKLAAFYCSESLDPFVPLPQEEPVFDLGGAEIPQEKVFCGTEIPIGEAADNAEELAKRILTEMENINTGVLGEIYNADVLAELPSNCIGSNCGSLMESDSSCCESSEDSCISEACTSCACTCTGSPCPAGIGSAASAIINQYGQIKDSGTALADLIKERVEEDDLKISSILDILDSAQEKLGACYNPKESYIKIELSESTILKDIYDCSYVKEAYGGGFPFYSENGDELKTCYGSPPPGSDLMNNEFCCYSPISF